jgi:putative oxidoreductase
MSKTKNYITWALTILMALAFLGAGFAKASGNDAMVQSFYAFDLPDWFRITIGIIEMIGGVLLLIPALSGMSSLGLSIIMIGAIFSHSMYDPITAAIPAFVFFIILTYIYLTRKNVVPKVLQKYLIG